jgi:hypothetical protein
MAITTPGWTDRAVPNAKRATAPLAGASAGRPVMWWGLIGGAFFAFALYLVIRWVSGPWFHSVSPGPIQPPTWMKAVQIAWMAIGIPLAGWFVWHFLIAPWRRNGRPTSDGLMVLACFCLVIQDPWSSYVQNWFGYNAWLPNMGSWVHGIPGWMAYGTPEHQIVEPILWSPFMYCYSFFTIICIGCWFMRRCATRWPGIGQIRLIAICFVFMMVIDFVLEGVVFLPLGFYTNAGGHWAIFPQSYMKFPLHEAVLGGGMFALLSSVRYFTDDRGNTLAERGVETTKLGSFRSAGLRFLAIYGALSVIVLCAYNIPTAVFAAHSTAWPDDIQKRSYLLDGLCGAGTNRACPGPGVPITIGTEPTPKPTRVVPFSGKDSAPFQVPIF